MAEKRYYMACLDLEGRDVLVVGGGPVALEKIEGLLDVRRTRDRRRPGGLRAGGSARPRSPRRADPRRLPGLRSRRSLPRRRRHLDDVGQRAVYADAEARGMLCNVVDVPELCSFILPAVHRADPIAVAISTGGASPALAQRLRDDVARLDHARARRISPASCASSGRGPRQQLPTYEARRDYFQRARRGSGSDDGRPRRRRARRPRADHRSRPRAAPRRATRSSTTGSSPRSSSTRRRRTRCASPATASTRRRSTSCSSRSGAQGLDVVRLKGGDPYVFGRGGEEALALAEAGVPFEVVPGVSSLAAVPAAAGIPVTHRGRRRHGHDRDRPRRRRLVARLRGARRGAVGRSCSSWASAAWASSPTAWSRQAWRRRTPAAVVSRGTLPDQEVVTAPLDRIAEAARGLPGPALVVVGDVVAIGARLRLAASRRRSGFEHAPDPAHGLADAVLVLDEREADEALAARRRSPSRGTRRPVASRARCSANASEPIDANRSGTGAQANIVPRGFGNDQPARSRPSQSASRRER